MKLLPLLLLWTYSAAAANLDLWSGNSGHFRIPILVVTKTGALLGFCENRTQSRGDSGNIDLVARRSTDRGATWSGEAVVWDAGNDTVSDCAAVVDQSDGAIWVIASWNKENDEESSILDGTSQDTRHMFKIVSRDDGLSWSAPEEITVQVKQAGWSWVGAGPGVGIQLQQGVHGGRLVIPCYHATAANPSFHGHLVWSDDHGITWTQGGSLEGAASSEGQIVERTDGSLLWNRRPENGTQLRALATSVDQGATWSESGSDNALIDPSVQASLIRYTAAPAYRTARLLFSNPANTSQRMGLTVRLSQDEGTTWSYSKEYYAGPAGYSCLAALPGGDWAVLYENGEANADERITFLRDTLANLSNGADSLDPSAQSASVVNRLVFYNNSSFDGNVPGANPSDDSAIAMDKAPLLPGQKAGFLNYTSYSRGLNGILIDITELSGLLTANEFEFRTGNDNNPGAWPIAPAPAEISVRKGSGVDGSDRVTLIWNDNAIQRKWLRITVRATQNSGLAADDVFYFGNTVGESGNNSGNAIVNVSDLALTHTHRSNAATILSPFDYNKDGLIDNSDLEICRDNSTSPLTALKLITTP